MKNWKQFLESNKDDTREEMKSLFDEFIEAEEYFRRVGIIDKMVEKTFNDILKGVKNKLNAIPEFKDKILSVLKKSIQENKKIAMHRSLKEGIYNVIDDLVDITEAIAEAIKRERDKGEEWKNPKEKELSELPQSEIRKRVDKALDSGDIEEFKKLTSYLDE